MPFGIMRGSNAGPFWAVLLMACSSTDGTVEKSKVEEPEEACVNTFPAERMPEQRITDYGEELLSREDILPERLSETVLYADIVQKEVHPAVQEFTPQFQLWSDAAEKRRWVYLPECEKIDVSDPNDWSFPVGTRFFKEFAIDGVRIETRLIQRIGEGPRDFAYASYVWNEEETEAERVGIDGLPMARGTRHDIPSKQECLRCHGSYSLGGGRSSRGLGFSAIQLNHSNAGLRLSDLQAHLSAEIALEDAQIQGDDTTKAALGYLHVNCGNCHHQDRDRLPQFDLNLWIELGVTSVQEYGAVQTAVDVPTQIFQDQHVAARIVSGDPDRSALIYRMHQRGNIAQMPPIATKTVDQEGLQLVSDWIEGLE